jgi:hypothetical protein
MGFIKEAGIFFEAAKVVVTRAVEIGPNSRVIAGLHDDAYFFNTRGCEFEQMIMNKSAGNAVRTDNGKQLLFHRM